MQVDEQLGLETFLKEKGIWYRFVNKTETTHTADASNVTGIPLSRITKNLVSQTEKGEHVLLVVSGDRRIDLKKASSALGVRNVSTVPFGKAESISGYPPGGTPTLGHKTPMRTVLDKSLVSFETVFCGGGSRSLLLELRVKDILEISQAIVADISEG